MSRVISSAEGVLSPAVRSFERHLNFYVDCRAAFANLDIVKDTLVLGVYGLAMRTRAAMRGRHNKRTSGFVKASRPHARRAPFARTPPSAPCPPRHAAAARVSSSPPSAPQAPKRDAPYHAR